MLRRLGDTAALPASGLEFNPPAHGTWNIVHIGMLVPQAHQIYVCAVNCMRGVVLTAAEMGARERFSCVVLKEEDILRGTVEEVTLRGISDALKKLPALPPCVIVFPVCTHHFLGVDMARVYRALENEFPTVDFVRAFMDPIFRKRLPPDQRLRKVMYDPLPACEPDGRTVCLMGSDYALEQDSDLRVLLASGGYTLADIQSCGDYAAYKALARAGTIVSVHPGGRYGAEKTAQRLGRRHLYLPMSFAYDEIAAQERTLCQALDIPEPSFSDEIGKCDAALSEALSVIGAAPIAVDVSAHPRPLGLARLLIEHGFRVTEVYADAVGDGEDAAFSWLLGNAPELLISPTVSADMRVRPRVRTEKTLAVGQKAAWFTGTPYFVNLVQGGGLWGFSGVRRMALLMKEAFLTEKDTRDIIPRKGAGCESCI